jgi:hypothetical protein
MTKKNQIILVLEASEIYNSFQVKHPLQKPPAIASPLACDGQAGLWPLKLNNYNYFPVDVSRVQNKDPEIPNSCIRGNNNSLIKSHKHRFANACAMSVGFCHAEARSISCCPNLDPSYPRDDKKTINLMLEASEIYNSYQVKHPLEKPPFVHSWQL